VRKRWGERDEHVVDVLDLVVPPEVRVDDPERLERVVDVRHRDPSVLEEAETSERRSVLRLSRERDAFDDGLDLRGVQILVREAEGGDERAGAEEDDELVEQVGVGCEDDESAIDEVVAARGVLLDDHRRLRQTGRVGDGRIAAVRGHPATIRQAMGSRVGQRDVSREGRSNRPRERDAPVLGIVGELARVARARVRAGDLGGLEGDREQVVHVAVGRREGVCDSMG
jgi:hypothetical protein